MAVFFLCQSEVGTTAQVQAVVAKVQAKAGLHRLCSVQRRRLPLAQSQQ